MKAMGPVPAEFQRSAAGVLTLGGMDARALAEAATPVFVYDRSLISERVRRLRAAMPEGLAIHYAVKANPFEPLLQFMAPQVDGFDLASVGELKRVQAAGAGGLPLSFAGPGKRDAELRAAVENGVTVHVESAGEAERLLRIAGEVGREPLAAVRVNPPFGLKGSGMKMGGLPSPFGVDHTDVPAVVRRLLEGGAKWRGLHVYSGSQSLSAEAIIESQQATTALARTIAEAVGVCPPEVNLGGGFGIPYFAGDQPLDIVKVGSALLGTLEQRGDLLRDTQFILELGRWLVGEAGVYLTRVIDRKESRGRTFLVVDGGLHHMLAASGNFGQLLRRNYPVAVADRFGAEPEEVVSVVGCLCTPLDMLADEVRLPRAEVGDLIAIFCAGAYGLSASPQAFLSQGAARELLV